MTTDATGAGPDGRAELRRRWGAEIARCRGMTATSRTALAARIGATPRAVRAWEAGERAPRLAMRQKICAALGIPPYLLDADGARCPRCHRPWDG